MAGAITIEMARKIAVQYLAKIETDSQKLALLDKLTIEQDFGWVFFYQSEHWLESDDPKDLLAGNAPVIVSRTDGSLHETGTAKPIEYYIDNFKRMGRQHS